MLPLTARPAVALLTVLFLGLALSGAGCTSSSTDSKKPVHPVRGKILVGDKPAAGAFILFVPLNEPAQSPEPRPRATADEDGSFALSTYGDKDGAPAGDYIVLVTWPGKVLADGREEPEDKLLGRYNNAARPALKATVIAGKNDLPTFQLK
jgi:hypothetical protein